MYASLSKVLIVAGGVVLLAFAASAQAQQVQVQTAMWRPVDPYAANQPMLGFHGTMRYGWGMYVNHVHYGSLAQRVGLEAGDVVLRINGRQITSRTVYLEALRDAANYEGGRIVMVVDNVRHRHCSKRYGTLRFYLEDAGPSPWD